MAYNKAFEMTLQHTRSAALRFSPEIACGRAGRALKGALVGVLALAIGACASLRPEPSATQAAVDKDAEVASAVPEQELDRDLLYKLLVAEMAGHRGELDLSVQNYLEAAHTTRDPVVVERATRIAVFARKEAAALEAAELWTEISPKSHEARRILVSLYLKEGRTDDAVRELQKLLDMLAVTPKQANGLLVEMLSRERDKEQALAVMGKFMENRADDPDATLAYASLAVRSGDLDLAADLLSGLLKEHPDHRSAILLYARVLQDQGKTASALKYLGRLLELEPDDMRYRMAYARLLVSAKRFDEALAEFRTLSAQKPEDADVRYALSLLLLQTNRPEEAEEQFQELIKRGQQVETAQYYLGQLAETREELDLAIERYSQVDEGQHHLDARVRIAVLLAKQGKLDEARERLHGVQTRQVKESVRLYLVESEILADAGKLDEAMAVYDRGLEEHTENSDLLYARAMLAEKMGRVDLLERDLRSVLSREPTNAQALNALGYTLADRTDRYEEAHELIAKALELKPDDYYILDSMGWVLYRLGRHQEALQYLRRAAETSDDSEVAAHLGEVLWVTGDKAGARQVWETALESTPDDQRLLDLMKRFVR